MDPQDTPELYAFVDLREGLPPPGGYGPLQASSPRGIAVIDLYQSLDARLRRVGAVTRPWVSSL